MANFYRVKDGNWDLADSWADASGGTNYYENPPTSSDDVFFDANTPTGTHTVNVTANTLDADFTGFTGTLAGTALINIWGSLTLSAGMTLSYTGTIEFESDAVGETIDTAGVQLNSSIQFRGDGEWTLESDFKTSGDITYRTGTVDFNDYDVEFDQMSYSSTGTRSLKLGNGTITVIHNTSGIGFLLNTTNLTFDAEGSTIKITGNSSFDGNGLTYNNIWISGVSKIVTILDSNTFNDFKIDAGNTVKFTDGTDQTVSSLTATGTSGNEITLTGTSTAGWTISDTTGTNTVSYCDISYSTAEGGATWCATNSTDSGNNTGWVFSAANRRRSAFFQFFAQ